MGSPKGRESYGDRVPVVVAGVTTRQGGREGRPQGEGAQVIGYHNRKVCEMQSAETVLGVLRERGRKGLPCNELYRQMFNRDLYLLAYGRIYANQGAMTPGADAETADGMSEDKIDQIIEAMRHERYRFRPVRRIYIPKKNGKLRPLGLPSWSDKLVGEVVRLLLEAYYEPTFSDHSHGFRPGRGCHTALREVERTWTGTTWFIEGDISDCFGSLDHEIMIRILAEKIHDNRFLRLIATDAESRVPGGLAIPRNAERRAARRRGVTDPLEYLPAQVGRLRRDGSDPAIHPRGTPEDATPNTTGYRHRMTAGTRTRGPGPGPRPAPPTAPTALGRPARPRIPSAALHPLRR